MESWSKNTKEGTETFQKRQGSGPRHKKEEDRILVKKKRGMEIEFFYKESPEASPSSLTAPSKKGKTVNGKQL